MTIFQSIIYGVVQGLTEFIPVSSTAHLRLLPAIMHWPDPGAAFTAVIQLGTVLAVLIYFWKDLSAAFIGWVRSFTGDKNTVEARTGWAVFYATIIIAVVAKLLEKYIEGPFRSLYVVAGSMIVMAVLMYIADSRKDNDRPIEAIQTTDGIKIGLWQCLALIPGMSRSGSSITGALFGGFDRRSAARLSFLMSVPAITLAGLYEGFKKYKEIADGMMTPTIIASIVSFVVGYACISWLINFLSTKGTKPFVAYRIVLGVLILVLCATGTINPDSNAKKADVPKETSTTSV
ncbi:MAG: undecaprenyl-diphosphatase UppP [Armatimonadota bacterium]